MKVMETERLLIRHFEAGDLQAIYDAVYSDPEVCRFYCGSTRTLEQVEPWLQFRSYQSQEGEWGLMAAVLRETDELIGLVGLQAYAGFWLRLEGEPEIPYNPLEVELTYAFGRGYWGRGYATEACRAMIGYAFRDLRLRRLVTGCDEENVHAFQLQKRLGMRHVRNLHPDYPGWEGVLENHLV